MTDQVLSDSTTLTGADALVHTLIGSGVTTCFANPGTSEMHFVAALDRIPGIKCVLGLHENVVTGMADGYFRVTGKPAATLLHCGPGLANGIANLHNARRAGAGIVNIVGDHAIAHVPFDSPLTADVMALAGSCSDWIAASASPRAIGPDAARAVQAAGAGYGNVATLVLPADVSWSEGACIGAPLDKVAPTLPDPHQIERAVAAIRSGGRVVIVLGAPALVEDAQPLLAGLQAAGVDLMVSPLAGRQPIGRGRLPLRPVPYSVPAAVAALAPYDHVVLINCPPPTAFFLYPGQPSRVTRPDAQIIGLARAAQDGLAALRALTANLDIGPGEIPAELPAPACRQGPVTPETLAALVCELMPEDAIIANESLTQGAQFPTHFPRMAPCDLIPMVGGAIGGGLPMATGAAIGAREIGQGARRVVSLQADGSAAYTLQSLWTQAREGLPCTTLLLNNRKYAILIDEYAKVGANPGPTAYDMLSLDRPEIDWAGIARSFGVTAFAVHDLDELREAFSTALRHDGPCLLDIHMA
jgi:acetolactate synthase-1/2/3 large subunit